ncbi:MAG: 4-(cytidine 5'-diphospho)-2-C-methyl-D-erythritol kinase [Rikenellaceae bacterium]|nr:4-(cytidine 5'-diphospho)-2-C-methyl-D-erythritol kinase [Rikenellaceae bacterium]
MITFPNCKINLGLRVTGRRPDGYHDIETVMVPVQRLYDTLEIIATGKQKLVFSASGIPLDAPAEENLCVKAYRLLQEYYGIGGVKMHLHKTIPFGAGLGGGSSDAVAALRMLNRIFHLQLPFSRLESLAAELGSDTVFFLHNRPILARGRGEILTPVELDLERYFTVIIKPSFGVSTAEAYRGITPKEPEIPLPELLQQDIRTWRSNLRNDFEDTVFPLHPLLEHIKKDLYAYGAVYASMSGSGSAIFGLFEHPPRGIQFPDCFTHCEGYML